MSNTHQTDSAVAGPKSVELHERARRVMAGGNSRLTIFSLPHPIYALRGEGCNVIDVDGIKRIDFANNLTALVHGHSHPAIVSAIEAQLRRGTCFSLPTESEVELAELLCARVASIDTVRFANSGSEAVMMALKAARAYSGKSKIAKAEGSYHGGYDYVQVSVDPSPDNWGEEVPNSVPYGSGTSAAILNEVVVVPWNDVETARLVLQDHADEVGAVIVDPLPNRCGLIPSTPEFLQMLRDQTRKTGALLIFDEVMSFRIAQGGAQQYFGVDPDLTVLGKIIGGGLPIGAAGGRADVMSVFDPSRGKPKVPHSGTFNANPMSMIAGKAAMDLMTPHAYGQLEALASYTRTRLEEVYAIVGVPGQVTGLGSLLRIHFTDRRPIDYRSLYPTPDERERLTFVFQHLLGKGILIAPTGLIALSTPMRREHVDVLADAFLSALRSLPAHLIPQG